MRCEPGGGGSCSESHGLSVHLSIVHLSTYQLSDSREAQDALVKIVPHLIKLAEIFRKLAMHYYLHSGAGVPNLLKPFFGGGNGDWRNRTGKE